MMIIAALLLLLPASPMAQDEDAAGHLEMYRKTANSCLKLNRGKMVMLRNTHPDRGISYRMARMVGKVRQGGLTVGTVRPTGADGENDDALGCEDIDGLKQSWQMLRAKYEDGS